MAEINTTTALGRKTDALIDLLVTATPERFYQALAANAGRFSTMELTALNVARSAMRTDDNVRLWELFDELKGLAITDGCSQRELALYLMADACLESAMTLH